MKDLKAILLPIIFGLPVLVIVFAFGLYFFGCGTNNTCTGIPMPDVTPIPTLIPATLPVLPTVVAQAATALPTAEATTSSAATPTAAAPEIARPSNPGGPGEAINLTGNPATGATIFQTNCAVCHGDQGKGGVINPGSSDGTVPPLNPIDSTLVSADYKTFATNVDLFIQHGSTPAGPSPFKVMPPWGDKNGLTQQQIADVIAYIISLNK